MKVAFEYFVAWRHLRDPERRSHRMLWLGIAVVVIALGLAIASFVLGHRGRSPDGLMPHETSRLVENLRIVGVSGLIVGAMVTYLGLLFASFTVFTAISIFGVFLGTFAPIVTLSVMSGFESDLKTKIRGTKADVVITAPDGPFTDWAEVRRRIAQVPGAVASTPYIESEVMIKAGPTPAGIMLRGIDPETASSVLDLDRGLRDGKLSDLTRTSTPTPIILGEELYAHTLRVFVGSDVDVICPLCQLGPSGLMPDSRPFRVTGHFYSGMYEFDSKLAYVSLAAAQKFLGMPGEVTGIDVRTKVPEDAPAVAEAIAALLGNRYDVRSWEELNRGLFMALRLEKIAMFVVLTFIVLVASFSIISTLIMNVTQKAREVAILKSMGADDGAIRRIFFAEGLYIGALGLAVGVASGVLACKLIMRYGLPLPTDVYYINQLPVVMRTGEIVGVATLALMLCCLATVYPAFLASRLRPVDGLRYE